MRYLAVSCPALGAVLCHSMPCFAELPLSCTADENASKHKELARAGTYVLEHFVQLPSYYCLSFSIAI